jgi:carboxypeptidase Taq
VELTWEDYTKNKKYSSAFVRNLSAQINKTFHAWIEARKQNSFAVYEKDLDALIGLKREEAALLGYKEHPYDALLDEYEKGATVAMLDKTFGDLLPQLKTILDKIAAAPMGLGHEAYKRPWL